jgi:uncharacterized integral membrane protein
MSTPPPDRPKRGIGRLGSVPVTTWIGIGGTAFLALIGLASGGVWSMLIMAALVLLFTAVYGLIFRRHTWLQLPRKRTAAALGVGIALAVLLGSTSAFGVTHPSSMTQGNGTSAVTASPMATHAAAKTTAVSTPTPVVTTKLVTETNPVPFQSTTVESATLAQGTSSITTAGVDGVETKTYTVTYSDGTETGRVLNSDVVTTPPVAQVTTVGTYVAPSVPTCTNGTYVNSAGNTVCSPEVSSSAPSGATAQCVDGTYSFSQSRRGTCSSHGGVAEWL